MSLPFARVAVVAALAVAAVFTVEARKESYASFETTFDKNPIDYAADDTMRVTVKVDRNGITNQLFYSWSVRDTVDMRELAGSLGPDRRKPVLLELPPDDTFTFSFAPGLPCAVKLVLRVVYANRGGAGEEHKYALFGRDEMRPLGAKPDDYETHWAKLMAELAAEPVRFSRRTPIEKDVRDGFSMFDVRVPCPGGKEVSGVLSLPKGAAAKSLPATVIFYGYCVEGIYATSLNRYLNQDPNRIWFLVNAHGIDNCREGDYYRALQRGELQNYGFDPTPKMRQKGDTRPKRNDNPDTTYFRGMMQRAIRAAEAIAAVPEWNGQDLEVQGGSQGGLQALTAAAYCPLVSEVSLIKPWFADFGVHSTFRPDLDTGLPYYDIVNHAKRVRAPVRMTVGIYDEICPIRGLMSLFNTLDCDKTIYFKHAGHSALDTFEGFRTNSVPVGRLQPIKDYPRAKVMTEKNLTGDYGSLRDNILKDAEALTSASTYEEASNLVARITLNCQSFGADVSLQRKCLEAGCTMKIDWNNYDEALRIGELRYNFIIARVLTLSQDREAWVILADEIGSLRKRLIPDYKPQSFICSSIHWTQAEQLACQAKSLSALKQDAEQQCLRNWSHVYWKILRDIGIPRCARGLRSDEQKTFLDTLAAKALLQETEVEELRRGSTSLYEAQR